MFVQKSHANFEVDSDGVCSVNGFRRDFFCRAKVRVKDRLPSNTARCGSSKVWLTVSPSVLPICRGTSSLETKCLQSNIPRDVSRLNSVQERVYRLGKHVQISKVQVVLAGVGGVDGRVKLFDSSSVSGQQAPPSVENRWTSRNNVTKHGWPSSSFAFNRGCPKSKSLKTMFCNPHDAVWECPCNKDDDWYEPCGKSTSQ